MSPPTWKNISPIGKSFQNRGVKVPPTSWKPTTFVCWFSVEDFKESPGWGTCGHAVDGTNPAPVEVGSLSLYLQGFIHPRWCRISSINSIQLSICLNFDHNSHIWNLKPSRGRFPGIMARGWPLTFSEVQFCSLMLEPPIWQVKTKSHKRLTLLDFPKSTNETLDTSENNLLHQLSFGSLSGLWELFFYTPWNKQQLAPENWWLVQMICLFSDALHSWKLTVAP